MAQYTYDTLFDFELSKIALPSGYTKQVSLISNGNQYILLPSTNGNPSGVQIEFKALTPFGGDKSIYGQISNNAPYLGQGNNNIIIAYKSGTGASWQTTSDTNKHLVSINYNGDKNIIFDNNVCFTATSYFTNNKPLAIFNAYYGNGVYIGQPCEIFYAEPTINDDNGNVLSRMKLLPAFDGIQYGLYDIENDIFYTNNGTGTFTSGGEAPTLNYQNGDEVMISSTKNHYHYQDGDLVFWYQAVEPLVFKGLSFEQTDFWQTPESVFRGFSFEYIDRKNGVSPLFFGQD